MAGVVALFDPDRPDQAAISLFYTTETAQLGVSLKSSSDGPDPDKKFAANEEDYPGVIVNPSQLAGCSYHGFNTIFAVTVPNTTQQPKSTNQISLVSPVYVGIGTNSAENKKLAVSASDDNAWVYYLDGPADALELKEFDYASKVASSHTADGDIRLNSSLAAWCDPSTDDRYVVCQGTNSNGLKVYSLIDKSTQELTSTRSAKPGTPVAVVHSGSKTFLYFADTMDNVRRVVKQDGQWSDAQLLLDSPPIGDGQLTVVRANDINHLFYAARDDTVASQGFTHIRDMVE